VSLHCQIVRGRLNIRKTEKRLSIIIQFYLQIGPLCISIETVKVIFFFVSGVEILQVLGVEVSIGGSTESRNI
jgi:hypothetical protein